MKDNSAICNYLKQSVEAGVFPGCHACIINQQEPHFFNVGYRSLIPNKELNQEDTIYDLASLTKVMVTTSLILKLIENNQLTLDTPVSKLLPRFTNKEIKLIHLLTHTSSLPADSSLVPESKQADILEMIYALPISGPSKEIVYSDLGFILLGEIIETLTNKNLNELSQEWLFKPMNMLDTSYLPRNKERCAPTELSPINQQIFKGIAHDRKARMMNGISGHAGLFSTIQDLSHFALMLLNQGVYQDKQILQPSSIALLYQMHASTLKENRGIGYINSDPILITPYNSHRAIVHTGFTGTSLLVDFDLQCAIIVLSNRVHPSRSNQQIIPWRNQFYEYVLK